MLHTEICIRMMRHCVVLLLLKAGARKKIEAFEIEAICYQT